MNQDLEHLRLLSIFHYVVGGLLALFACFPLLYFVFGLVMLVAPAVFEDGRHGPPNDAAVMQIVGVLMMFGGTLFALIGWAYAVCILFAGQFLSQRRHYTFCLVIAALLCMNTPFGTILGVFTIVVLMRPSVKLLFEPQSKAVPV
jgi:hypothetical protein